jgi:putative acetyltransferase
MPIIRHAKFPKDAAAVIDIFEEYVLSPVASLDYQNYETEFANLPGSYKPPDGMLLLAECGPNIVGCIAYRKVSDTICEMKRLYVRPPSRGTGIGQRLVERLLIEAAAAGYLEVRLDVLGEFKHAQRLYKKLGFVPADAVSFNPVPGTLFLGLLLKRDG